MDKVKAKDVRVGSMLWVNGFYVTCMATERVTQGDTLSVKLTLRNGPAHNSYPMPFEQVFDPEAEVDAA